MPITFQCSCGGTLQAPEKFVGQKMRCHQCGQLAMVEGSTSVPTKPAKPASSPAIAPKESAGKTVIASDAHFALFRGSAQAEQFAIGSGGVLGREAGKVQFLLDHPHVSRRHASLKVSSGRVVLTNLSAANGTFVNGQRIDRPTELEVGDRLDIGPFALEYDGDALVSTSRANNVELSACAVERVVTDRATGKSLPLLNGVTIVIRPREFVALLGPSGSGKTTLLTILSGRDSPDAGFVRVNDRDRKRTFSPLE